MLPRVAWLRHVMPRFGAQRARVPIKRDLSTLNPARVTSVDYVDLSGRVRLYGATFVASNKGYIQFPSRTHGFFYYVPGPAHAPIAGEVRFRCTPEAAPTSFPGGHDLLLADSPVPWRIPLVSIIQSKLIYKHVLKRLCDDGFISEDLIVRVREDMAGKGFVNRATPILHSLSQPFFHDVSKSSIELRVAVGPRLSERTDMIIRSEYYKMYTGGHILCRFEASNHKGRQALALRVLETFQIEQNSKARESGDTRASVPVAGELFKTAGGEVWTHVLREGYASTHVLRPLLSDVPETGYISRSTRQRTAAEAMRTVRNLAPAQLTGSDWMDLSWLPMPMVYFVEDAADATALGLHMTYNAERTAFPEGTTGFFYALVPDPAHPVGAQLRFRVVNEPDPAAFAAGHDLRAADGTPWYNWLPTLVRAGGGDAVHNIVVQQGVVERGVVDQWRAAGGVVPFSRSWSPLVCPGAAPFVLDLSKHRPRVILGTGVRARAVSICQPFSVVRNGKYLAPFEGHALVNLVENRPKKRYDIHVLDVSGLRVPPETTSVPIPLPGVFRFGSGRGLWRAMQKLQAAQVHA